MTPFQGPSSSTPNSAGLFRVSFYHVLANRRRDFFVLAVRNAETKCGISLIRDSGMSKLSRHNGPQSWHAIRPSHHTSPYHAVSFPLTRYPRGTTCEAPTTWNCINARHHITVTDPNFLRLNQIYWMSQFTQYMAGQPIDQNPLVPAQDNLQAQKWLSMSITIVVTKMALIDY